MHINAMQFCDLHKNLKYKKCYLKFIGSFDEKRFAKKIVKIYKYMGYLEKMKYLEPLMS